MAKFLIVADRSNNRIVKILVTPGSMTFDSEIGSLGTGNDQFHSPQDVTHDGTNLYVADAAFSFNHRIVKRLATDLSWVSSTNDADFGPFSICADNTNLYLSEGAFNFITRRPLSSLSVDLQVSQINPGAFSLFNPQGITSNGTPTSLATSVYFCNTNVNRVHKISAVDFSHEVRSDAIFSFPSSVVFEGSSVYVGDAGNSRIVKCNATTLALESSFDTFTGSPNNNFFSTILGVASDGTYLYVADSVGTFDDRIIRFSLSTLAYVDEIGLGQVGPTDFRDPEGMTIIDIASPPSGSVNSSGQVIW